MPATIDMDFPETNSLLPLVSIGLPTFNGAKTITQAIKSVLKQSYRNIELVISDNASEDETEIICQRFCEVDDRVTYIRQRKNQGSILNFLTVVEKASGTFFMWLGDDDILDENYIYECLKVLINYPEYSLVGGVPNYFKDGQFLFRGVQISLPEDSGKDRVIHYYSQVVENGIIYSIMKRQQVLEIWEAITLSPPAGLDYVFVSAMVFLGKSIALDHVTVNRNWNWSNWGTEETIQRAMKIVGASRFQATNSELCVSIAAFSDIAWKSISYQQLSLVERFSLGWDVLITRVQFHQLNIQTNLLDTFRFIDQGHGSQETKEAIAALRQVRLELAKHWFSKSLEDVATSYSGDYAKVQQILPITGIKDEPLTGDEQYFLEDIATCVMNRGFNHSAFIGYFLILMLYYYPHQFPQEWYEGVSIPEWFMDEFLKFLLVNPAKFSDRYDAENYYNYAVDLVNYLHGKIATNQNSSTWQYIRKFVGENANFYLLNSSDRDLSLLQQQLQEICN
ncbi:MAG: glycosyltransferase family 2 protein [Coleofasciculaceae cyanobacterium SM2_1_6]|nr:glycosyltransferase family 2 protein [Coleofasciculaceae cyanobacterium SM2_1_6]